MVKRMLSLRLAVLALSLWPALATGQATTRTLSFPAGASLGRLIAIDPENPQAISWWSGWDFIGESLGEARGEVVIPAGTRLALGLNAWAVDAVPAALAKLPAGTIEMIANHEQLLDESLASVLGKIAPPTGLYLHLHDVTIQTAARLERLKTLKGLRVSNDTPITSPTLAALGRLKSLDNLFLEWRAIDCRGLGRLAELPALKHLSLLNASAGPGLHDLAKLPALEELIIRNLEGPGLRDLALPPSCKTLRLNGFGNYQEKDFAQIERLRGLEGLVMTYVIDDHCVTHLKALSSLKQLSIIFTFTSPVDDRRLSDAAAATLAEMPSLESLHLAYGLFTDRTMESLAKMPKLKKLYLSSNAGRYTEAGLRALGRAPVLEELWLRGVSRSPHGCSMYGTVDEMTDKELMLFAEYPRLQKLTIMKRGQITDAGLAQLKQRRPGLKVVIEQEQAQEEARKRAEKRKAEKMKTGQAKR